MLTYNYNLFYNHACSLPQNIRQQRYQAWFVAKYLNHAQFRGNDLDIGSNVTGLISNMFINFLALKTMTDTFSNSADPDETAHNEPSHQDLLCLQFCP